MKSYDLLLLGASRTATYSMWRLLSQHHKIYFDRLDNLRMDKIFEFLKIDKIKENMEKTNILKEKWDNECFDELKRTLAFQLFYKDSKILTEIFNEDLEKTQEITKIDLSDWME